MQAARFRRSQYFLSVYLGGAFALSSIPWVFDYVYSRVAPYSLLMLAFPAAGTVAGIMLGIFSGSITQKLRKRTELSFSSLENIVLTSESFRIVSHPELVDLYEAMQRGEKIKIPKPQSREFFKVCKTMSKRVRDPLARKLYKEKILNYQGELFNL